ncbi:MAG TPA: efflux RND transporter periplasmic adaptor subunit [Phycisphaerales bacterium]|nr:efflux RND transporter periplasmic adaptor subunit [Phycisphaerales bacterium]
MKRHPAITFIIVLIIAVGFTAWYSRSLSSRQRQISATMSRLNLIKTSLPQHKDFNIVAYFVGRAEVRNKVIITALEAGTISSVDADDEAVVKKGTLLFTLGGVRIKACLASIEQKIKSLKQQVALAKNTLSRKQQAAEQKIVSLDELDKAKADLAQLNARLKRAAGQLDVLETAIHIYAPMSGIFTQRRVSIGQKVEKTDVLAEIIAPNDLRVAATLFPPENAQLQGRTAAIHTASGKTLSGVVTSVLPQRTSAGGTTVWIKGNDINRQLKAGETISGDILLATHKKALALPEKALVRDEQEKTYVFVKQAEGYTKQKVQTGLSSDGWVEILSGLTEADEVVTEGAYELFYRDFNKVYKVAD